MSKLVKFNAAVKAKDEMITSILTARLAQYKFLALVYLAYMEGKKNKKLYKEELFNRLGRDPSLPEAKRPFLHLLHALVDDSERTSMAKLSKLTSSLEAIELNFKGSRLPNVKAIIDFITEIGGNAGLIAAISNKTKEEAVSPIVAELGPDGIDLPVLGARLTRVGRGYRLRLPDWAPGEYIVRLRVGRNGYLEAITDDAAEEAA